MNIKDIIVMNFKKNIKIKSFA